jgi:hypothetical protein
MALSINAPKKFKYMKNFYFNLCFWVSLLTGTTFNSNAQTGCNPSTITPYIQVNGTAWQQISLTTVNTGDNIIIGPQPLSDYTWKWTGPNGFTANTREISINNIQSNQGGNYTATFTNACGAQSQKTFTINVTPNVIVWYTISCVWKNQTKDGYLYDNGTNVSYGSLGTGDNYRWIPEDAGNGYQRLKNKATGKYMNIATSETNVKCSSITDNTSQWTIGMVSRNAFLFIKNRSNNKYLNIENNQLYTACDISNTPEGNSLCSAQWNITYAGETSIPVTGITVTPSSISLLASQGKMLSYILAPSIAVSKVNWTSSNSLVATVSTLGYVKAVNPGTARITGTIQNGSKTATCTVTVSAAGTGTVASRAVDFLNSIGVVSHLGQSDETVESVVKALNFTGIRSLRVGPWPERVPDWINIYKQTGVKSLITCSGPDEAMLTTLLNSARQLANNGALLAIEGANEPNNFAVKYQGQRSAKDTTSIPAARWQREFYRQAKADAVLKNYAVFHSSEGGGSQPENTGLQFLTIPSGAGTLMPEGTQFADYANIHNYICRLDHIIDNMSWDNASSDDVTSFDIDGIYKEYGYTWHAPHFNGYTNHDDRVSIPKVTTETGWPMRGNITEEQQARLYLNMYLAQFKRGFSYTFIYMLKDGPWSDEVGFGIHDSYWNPRKCALYLHNLTTILNDNGSVTPDVSNYSFSIKPAETTHDLLLQKSNGNFMLVLWGERFSSTTKDKFNVNLGGTCGTVKVYDPTLDAYPVNTYSNVNTVPVELLDHPLIIEFNPSGLKSMSIQAQKEEAIESNILSVAYLSDNSVNIDVNLNETYTINIINTEGKIFKAFQGSNPGIYKLERTQFSRGIYIINIISDSTVQSRKIVME